MTVALPLPLPGIDRAPQRPSLPPVRAINAAIQRFAFRREGRATSVTINGIVRRITGARRRHGHMEVRLLESGRWVGGVEDIHIG